MLSCVWRVVAVGRGQVCDTRAHPTWLRAARGRHLHGGRACGHGGGGDSGRHAARLRDAAACMDQQLAAGTGSLPQRRTRARLVPHRTLAAPDACRTDGHSRSLVAACHAVSLPSSHVHTSTVTVAVVLPPLVAVPKRAGESTEAAHQPSWMPSVVAVGVTVRVRAATTGRQVPSHRAVCRVDTGSRGAWRATVATSARKPVVGGVRCSRQARVACGVAQWWCWGRRGRSNVLVSGAAGCQRQAPELPFERHGAVHAAAGQH